ncbi:DNA gyrase inhibitor YacG [Sediminicurvatus halobius]|uniref:DNA gyrase inhibitor YacG n=1 Tax=Sediminicurvatus halobius TaxID=2182432 RepID=A0A2U2N866_9GAMM|nr:DNA gyrase inhibitor YacG [Spiribacter halobius]PWG65164.1 DNA gyrase inhibitor YacG [Spiribacter halobius]UEX78886.1 DNA gyrase inhibitor YacG [Spiribacter halobius]
MTTVHCPTCGTPVEWTDAARYRPFCSRRCKLIDLGEWLDERHRIPGEPADETTLDSEWREEDDPR